jgi:hypothetical protein
MSQGSFDFGPSARGDDGNRRGPPASGRERVWIARGPREAEALLLGAVARELEAARANPRLLADPVRVIVPSRSLREHVAARLARRHRGLAGVVVQTLRGFARELLQRAGEADAGRGGDLLLPLLVRRIAPQYPALREALEALDEGYAPVVETVRDLLDAGLDEHTPAADVLADLDEGAPVARARAIAALALRVRDEIAACGLGASNALFERATAALERDGGLAHARALFLHGYADLTGVQLGLLKQLLASERARIVIDHPPDPTGAGGVGAFTQRLRERLAAPAPPPEPAALPPPPTLLRAPGAQAEAREVAERIRALLGADARLVAESIGIVARDLQPYRFALSTHLRRLGVPFSGGPGFVNAAGRRLRALLALLEEPARAPADRWLDAADLHRDRRLDLADLRLALHALGRGRLGEVAELDLAAALGADARYRLPVRTKLASDGEAEDAQAESEGRDGAEPPREGSEDIQRAVRRSVSRASLEWARDGARATLEACRALESAATLARQTAALRALVGRALRWRRETAGRALLDSALASLARELPAELAVGAREFRVLLERALRDAGISALGGAGGGVQLLSATAARGRTFSHLFVLGLGRDAFPRVVNEDALLPDRIRRSLAVVLPDVPIKSRGYAEERFLFAQLCDAAPRVTLSWQETSDDGKERPVSPLVQQLRIAHGLETPAPSIPLVWSERAGPRPAHEHAVLAGLAGDARGAAHAAGLALAPLLGDGARAAGAARAASLAFRDDFGPAPVLGPHLGQIGPVLARTRALSVTRVEAIARCPWRAFLEKLLGLEPPPDALAALPELSPLLLGNSVHGALEQIAVRAGVPAQVTLAEALAGDPLDVPWPEQAELAGIVARAARGAAVDQGILLPGFAELLAHRADAVLARARALDWREGVRRAVRGVEVECALDVAVPEGAPLRLTCRADRLDQEAGRLVLTDYKTGRPISELKTADARRRKLSEAIADGTKLQAAAYARAPGSPATGRYLFLRTDIAEDIAEARVHSDGDAADLSAFESAVGRAAGAWRRGELTPELIQDEAESEGEACRSCEVSEACWKDDPGAKRRLAAWREAQRTRAAAGDA